MRLTPVFPQSLQENNFSMSWSKMSCLRVFSSENSCFIFPSILSLIMKSFYCHRVMLVNSQ